MRVLLQAQGVPTYRYIVDRDAFKSPRTNPDNLCFCNRTDLNQCPLDGLFDTSLCSHGTCSSRASKPKDNTRQKLSNGTTHCRVVRPTGAPTLISYPHFYLTDPAAMEPFEGMQPNPDDHDMYADVHPVSLAPYLFP